MAKEDDPPNFWAELCLEGTHCIPLEKDASIHLLDDWLTPDELIESKHWGLNRQERVCRTYQAPKPKMGSQQPTAMTPSTAIAIDNDSLPVETPSVPPILVTSNIPVPPEAAASIPPVTVDPSIRRSCRSNKGAFSSTKYIDEVYLMSVQLNRDHQDLQLAYLAELHTDIETGIFNCNDPRAYAAKVRKKQP